MRLSLVEMNKEYIELNETTQIKLECFSKSKVKQKIEN